MWWTILRMLATSSLSAFSTAPTALPSASPPAWVNRSLRAAAPAQSAAPQVQVRPPTGSPPAPMQILPRGSLLNLSV
jgi:hypothetical protein